MKLLFVSIYPRHFFRQDFKFALRETDSGQFILNFCETSDQLACFLFDQFCSLRLGLTRRGYNIYLGQQITDSAIFDKALSPRYLLRSLSPVKD